MSALFAGMVGGLYSAGVVGVHRLNVWRMRQSSGGFAALGWLDWDTLLEGLIPPPLALVDADAPAPSPRGRRGEPVPAILLGTAAPGVQERQALLRALVEGHVIDESAFTAAGFSGGQVRWLTTLGLASSSPVKALERLEAGEEGSAAEVYLREHLALGHRTHLFNLELAVFSAKQRLRRGLARFGDHPALFFVRAQASARLGFNKAAIDDLARAVYFSRQSRFYLQAVLDTPYIEEVRPALAQQCRWAMGEPRD